MEEVSDHLQPNTSKLTVRSCAEEHYSIRLNLGEKHESKDLEVRDQDNHLRFFKSSSWGQAIPSLTAMVESILTTEY